MREVTVRTKAGTLVKAPDVECRECGVKLGPEKRAKRAAFCCAAHRTAWHNRRKERGAELYDFVMAWRFDRDLAETIDARGLMGRLASAYIDADKTKRAGRLSWSALEAIARIPLAFSDSGDNR